MISESTRGRPAGDVVLVNPAMTGRGYKAACRRRALPMISLYTLDDDLLSSYERNYREGDERTLHALDAASAAAILPGPVRGVVPTTEPSVVVSDELAALLGVAGNPAATALARRSKSAMRHLARGAGVRVPDFELVPTDQVCAAAARLGFPSIAKPQTGAGSHGVVLMQEPGCTPALERHDLFGCPNEHWLVEQYVRGRELAVNAFSQDGRHRVLDIWEYRQPSSADYDQPYWDIVQLPQDDPDWAAAAEFVLGVLDSFLVELGPSHTEIKMGPAGPCLIEIATRLPGAHMTDHWRAHSAIRPYDDTLAVYLGEDPGLLGRELAFDAALGICCLRNDDRPGVLQSLTGLEDVRRMPGVDAVFGGPAPGDHVPLTHDLGSVLAFILVHGQDTAEVETIISTVRDRVRWELS